MSRGIGDVYKRQLIDTTDLTIDEAVNAVLKNLKNIGAEAHK